MQEFEKTANTQENRIKDILEKTENDIKEGKIVRRSDKNGAEEFVFSGGETGLVFEKELPSEAANVSAVQAPTVAEAEKHDSLVMHEKNAPRVEEVTLVSNGKKEVITVDITSDAGEFSLPSSFTVDEKYNTPIMEERRTLYSTYVPKFTDASENYRMADQPRPPKKTSSVPSVDPTAEDEGETRDAVIIGVGDTPVSVEAILNITKPAAASESSPLQESVRTVEDEREEISSLLATPAEQETPATKAETVEEVSAQAELAKTSPLQNADEPYTMPDPEEGALRILDYPEDVAKGNLPAETAAAPAPMQRKLFAPKEYVNVGQKMAFKDMFLDRLNSVAVRLGAAILLTLILCVLENAHLIGLDLLALFKLQRVPFALALLDMQIVICLFLLSAPEIMRGIRSLTKGMFHSELFLPIIFVLQMLHAAVMLIAHRSVGSQYGFVFGLFVIATIVGSYLRHHASFLTFRHVGGREEKLAVEKKMTRLLEKEKFALDGAVDEYKSKTVHFLRTNFVSDFFARERKSAENTRHNLKYLLISLGISLVAGIVMYFIGNGMVSAVSTLTLTFYLCAPVALLLAHRLPYYQSVRAASAVGGGVVGETSHYDYAGVDVVCYRDTEIFPKGDVSLKHIILYDTTKEFTTVVEQMSSLFSVVGGPLDVLFSETLVKKCPPAEEAFLENGGIFGRIGDVVLHVGDAAYMSEKGIALPKEKDNRETIDFSTKVMYAAENGRIYAKFYLQYKLNSAFRSHLASFAEEKIVTLVYTRDPNVTDALMRHLADGRDLIRVIKEDATVTMPQQQERVSVGLVSTKGKASAISLLLLCRRYVRMQKKLLQAFWFALGSGAFLGVMLSVFGLISLPSIVYGIWQGFLVGAMAIYAGKTLAGSKGPSIGGKDER